MSKIAAKLAKSVRKAKQQTSAEADATVLKAAPPKAKKEAKAEESFAPSFTARRCWPD